MNDYFNDWNRCLFDFFSSICKSSLEHAGPFKNLKKTQWLPKVAHFGDFKALCTANFPLYCWIVLKSFPRKFSTHFRSTMYWRTHLASSNPVLHHGSCHLKIILKKNYIAEIIIIIFFLIIYYKSMMFMIVVKILRQLK